MGSCVSKQSDVPIASSGSIRRRQKQKVVLSQVEASNEGRDSDSPQNETLTSACDNEKADSTLTKMASSANMKEVKVLLLGSGESGKSTVVKQMKILHQGGFSAEELEEYRPFVYKNTTSCIANVIHAIMDLSPELIRHEGELDQSVSSESTDHDGTVQHSRGPVLEESVLKEILEYEAPSQAPFDKGISKKIQDVYFSPEVQDFIKYEQGNFYLIDSTDYFISNLDRISREDYIPSVNDVLRTRKKTSGIFDFIFQSGGLKIHMFDVGGQRSERKKWIHCFDNVTCIIFCVALSEYDQVLLEENNQNRLEESLTLFDSVVNSRWFSRTSIILFLNKIDIFAQKLPYSPLENHFPDYTGGNDINKAAKYILWRFTKANRSGLNIYTHVTQATDTSNIELVFAAVRETILENTLKDSGLL